MTEHRTTADPSTSRGIALAWVSWVAGLLAYLWTAATGFSLDGLTPSEETKVLVGVTVAMALTTVLPFMGLCLALVQGRALAAVGLGLALALALVPVAAVGPDAARDWRDRTAPEPTPARPNGGCAVHSGGTNTCPGG
ncbi:hypothetical protein [Aeromicrobium erythreum]|uniref:Uncharacterized protein n=1 Tax=Aeromicrobium erythreum TaxID=2041 RepID=A0A0U4BLH5_9ACTN|nr:hypothetical protein [Aeromicrobium erythreum]ALX05953.1 hypothetical protein AERYTH_15225 [Aeromicrobium erythreum]